MAVLAEIPTEIITVGVLLAVSFVSWLKDRIESKDSTPYEPPVTRTDEWGDLREEVLDRQRGEGEGDMRDVAQAEWLPPERPVLNVPEARPYAQVVVDPPMRDVPPSAPETPRFKVPDRPIEMPEAVDVQLTNRKGRSVHRRRVDRLLRSPYAAKEAILLTEILGPPVAMRAHEGAER